MMGRWGKENTLQPLAPCAPTVKMVAVPAPSRVLPFEGKEEEEEAPAAADDEDEAFGNIRTCVPVSDPVATTKEGEM